MDCKSGCLFPWPCTQCWSLWLHSEYRVCIQNVTTVFANCTECLHHPDFYSHACAGPLEVLSGWGGHWSQCYLQLLAFALSAWKFLYFIAIKKLSYHLAKRNISNSVQTKMEHTASSLSNCLYYNDRLSMNLQLCDWTKTNMEINCIVLFQKL